MLKHRHPVYVFLLIAALAGAARAEEVPYAKTKIEPPTPEWSAGIEKNAPAEPTVEAPKRKLLVFSLRTGYDHKVIPHVNRVFEILGEKSGAFETTVTVDIEMLAAENLSSYGVLVLNNNCINNGWNGDGAGIWVVSSRNRIEANNVHDNDRGIDVDANNNFIIKNNASGNGSNYPIVAGNTVGPITAGGGTITTTNPWANFSY